MFAKNTEATTKFLFQKDMGYSYRKCCVTSMFELPTSRLLTKSTGLLFVVSEL